MKNKLGSLTWNEIMKALFALKDDFEFRLGMRNLISGLSIGWGREIS